VILGLGSDIVSVARIAAVFQRHRDRFLRRVFSAEERDYCLAARDPSERLAARWAAKEACMKALGTGWAAGVTFTQISVSHEASGAPQLALVGSARERAQALGAEHWHCSLSHADGMALAVVLLEG